MGSKWVNCCKPEKRETGRLNDKKEESREKSIRGSLNKFEMEGFMAQKGLWDLV